MSDWKQARFGDLLSEPVRNGIYKSKEFHGKGSHIVNMGELFAYPRLRTVEMKRVMLTEKEKEKALLRNNDLIFARRSLTAEGAGKCSLVCDLKEETTFESSIIRARPDPLLANSDFLFYYFNSPQGKHSLGTILRQVAVSGITGTDLTELILRIPPIGEQKAIAKILSSLDDKIELNRRMNGTLEAMARALFKAWFVDFEPVHANLENRPSTSASPEIAKLFPSNFENGTPKGWSMSPLPTEISFLEGPGLRNWQYRDEGMKFLNIRCIQNGDLDIKKASCISVEEFRDKYSHFALQADDIVISTSGTLGRLSVVREDHLPVMLNTSIIRMRGNAPVGLAFVWNYLQSDVFVDEMFAAASGSVQLNFGPVHLKQIKTLRPTDAILTAFESIGANWLHLANRKRQESQKLAEIRDSLLPRLISGRISTQNETHTL
ncbi:MAG: restriction endonuclease subunit S [Acidobacteria bacterium]|nr:restriction endonuclease subunit S [Acidobacteriota bacterium]